MPTLQIPHTKNDTKFLHFVRFRELEFWDYNTYFQNDIQKHTYPTVKLEEIIKQRKWSITIDDTLVYKRPTVKLYWKWVFLRDEIVWKDIKVKRQQICHANDLLVAEIDAKVWGFWIIPDYLEWAIVSSHYFLFEVDTTKLSLAFISMYMQTQEFQKQVQATWSTNYAAIRPAHFLSYSISLPDLDTQSRIVREYSDRMIEAERLDREVTSYEKDIETYLMDTLGITTPKREQKKWLQFVRFRDLERWDAFNSENFFARSLYPIQAFGDLVDTWPHYWANTKTVKKITDIRYIRITDINEDWSLNDEIVSAEEIDKKFFLGENDFLLARSGNTVWKSFLYKEKYGKCIYAWYLVKYRLDFSKILPEYILYYTKSASFKHWINISQRVAGQPNINGQEYLKFPIPLPPLSIQSQIVEHIDAIKATITSARTRAESLRNEAKENFERELFS